MTTHYVQIRLRNGGELAPWEALTQAPIPLKDAQGLLQQIGSSWESRIVIAPSSERIDYALLVERLNLIAEVAPEVMEYAWDDRAPDEDIAEMFTVALRNGLFGVLERYRGPNELVRWRTDDHNVVHAKKCKGGKVTAHTKVLHALTGKPLDAFTELQIRAQHVTVQTIPGLGVPGTLQILQPKLHIVSCPSCDKTSEAVSVVAEATIVERTLRREYRLQ